MSFDTKKQVIASKDWDGPVYAPGFGGGNEGFYDNVQTFLESREGMFLPSSIHSAKRRYLEIKYEDVLDAMLDEHHDGISKAIVDHDELYDFLKAWNAKQTAYSLDQGDKVISLEDQPAYQDYLKRVQGDQ